MKRLSANRTVLLVAAALLLLSVAVRIFLIRTSSNAMKVKVYVDNELFETLPLPSEGEMRFRVDSGDGGYNLIALDSGGVRMLESNCPKHSCIEQGRVDAENCESRPLGHWILCLPHRVSVELVTDE